MRLAPIAVPAVEVAHRARPRLAQRAGEQLLGVFALEAVEQLLGLQRRVAEVDEAVAGEGAGVAASSAATIADSSSSAPATFSRSSTMIRSAVRLPIPGTAWKRLVSPAAIARRSSRGAAAGERRDRHFRADAADRDQHPEEVALLFGGEAVEGERVLARDQLGVQEGVGAGRRDRLQRLRGDREPVADAGGVDHDVVGAPHHHLAADGGDHPATRSRAGCAAPASRGDGGAVTAGAAVADRDRERVGGVVGGRRLGQPEQGADHPLDLALAGAAGAADGHLDRLRRVGEAVDAAPGRRPASPRRWPGRRPSPSRTFLPK